MGSDRGMHRYRPVACGAPRAELLMPRLSRLHDATRFACCAIDPHVPPTAPAPTRSHPHAFPPTHHHARPHHTDPYTSSLPPPCAALMSTGNTWSLPSTGALLWLLLDYLHFIYIKRVAARSEPALDRCAAAGVQQQPPQPQQQHCWYVWLQKCCHLCMCQSPPTLLAPPPLHTYTNFLAEHRTTCQTKRCRLPRSSSRPSLTATLQMKHPNKTIPLKQPNKTSCLPWGVAGLRSSSSRPSSRPMA